ncbi:MAG TPA: hypothetical protein ENK06_02815, partial [Gammaproteobacteria bacterium]|nr:hypothetical protein [Gammaproteobacteria bacterium]
MTDSEEDLSEFSMLDLFRMELETQLEKLNQGLLDIEQGNAGAEILESLMRAAHSIKGAARMVNVEPVVKIAHEVEDCFVALQKNEIKLDKSSTDHLLAGIDLIAQVGKLNDEQLKNWELDNQSQVNELVRMLGSVHRGSGRETKKTGAQFSEAHKTEPVKGDDFKRPAIAEGNNSLTIRIPVDRLDRMLDLAGKSLVQTHELNAVMPDFWQIKHKQKIIISQLNQLQEQLSENNASDALKERVKSILGEENQLRLQYADGIAKLDTIDRRSSTIADYLHREIISSRMRPISEILNGLPRMVRDFSHRLNKSVRLQMTGLYTLVDRHVLEHIDTPIKHILQNAIDHGIELPEVRLANNKPAMATLTLTVSMNAGMLLIELQDDGAGVNFDQLRAVIRKKGMASQAELASLDQKALLDYLFYPGFSTQQHVTEISGRGVGLDLVKDVVERLNGSVHVSSVENQGVKFQLCLPLGISVVRVLLTTICGESYAFPASAVRDVKRIHVSELVESGGRFYASVDNARVLLLHANQIFGGALPK